MGNGNILLTGGGTAGHVMPCVALLPELRKKFDRIYYMGRPDSIEERIAKNNGLIFLGVDCRGLSRSDPLKNLGLVGNVIKSGRIAVDLMSEKGISVIFSKGGYASFPAVTAAKKLNIPLVIHESDRTMGLANKMSKRYAVKVLTSFPDTAGGVFVGNPLRREIFSGNGEKVRRLFSGKKPILLVLGGSQGASQLNDFVLGNMEKLKKDYDIFLICGKNSPESIDDGLICKSYVENIWDCYSAADVVISRCGANCAAELAALKKRTVFVPLSGRATRGDQILNAEFYSGYAGFSTCGKSELSVDLIYKKIAETKQASKPRYKYDKNTDKRIVDILCEIAESKDQSFV